MSEKKRVSGLKGLFAAMATVTLLSCSGGKEPADISFSDYEDQVKSGNILSAEFIDGQYISGKMRNGDADGSDLYKTISPGKMSKDNMDIFFEGTDVDYTGAAPEEEGIDVSTMLLLGLFSVIAIVSILSYRRQGKMPGMNDKGKNKAKLLEEDNIKVRFVDVAGVDEAKEEVEEMVDFLKDPKKYTKLGAKMPTGALMVGPPGTGKTLLARAIAGEAGVPFFTVAGSDFVEMFVGVGASRVREMFEAAKKKAPCIIFIDEIDAVGGQRKEGGGMGGNDEKEQTLNALLVEMDGFEGNEGVIVIAATNRVDTLDKALLRPGRFDREINVGLPDIKGREQILNVHMKKLPQGNDIEISDIAKGTPGSSGADLANLVNEAAIFAAKEEAKAVGMKHLEEAKDKLLMGGARKSMVMGDDAKRLTAYHEAGHAIVGRLSPEHDPVYKVSIMPRGRALGVTMFLPEEDEYSKSELQLNSMLASFYGGRIAEEMIYGDKKGITTGASNDIERATDIANQMVGKWGIFPEGHGDLKPMDYAPGENKFGAKSLSQVINDNEKLLAARDATIDNNYKEAQRILEENKDILQSMTEALMKYETIDKYQLDQLMNREDKISAPRGYGEVIAANNNNEAGSVAEKMSKSVSKMQAHTSFDLNM